MAIAGRAGGGPGSVTVTFAEALLCGATALAAVTWKSPAWEPAVKMPPAVMLPPVAFQVTAALLVPVTVARNCRLAPKARLALAGDTATVIGASAA
jgi:hypothetical protein